MVLAYVAAGVLFWRKSAGLDDRERRAWRLMAVGLWLASIGVVATGVAVMIGVEIGAFGLLDSFYVAAYVFGIGGLWTLPSIHASGIRRTRIALDSFIGGLSVVSLMWVLVVDDIVKSIGDIATWRVAVGMAYPALDAVVLVTVMIVVLRRSQYRFDARLLFYGLAFAAQGVADLAFLQSGIGSSFADVTPYFPGFLLAGAFLVASASIVDRPPSPSAHGSERNPWWALAMPYVAVVALVALVIREIIDGRLPPSTTEMLIAVLIVGVLVVGRQAAALREYRELVEARRSSLVSSVAHELRTPLTAVVGFLSIVAEDRDGVTDRDDLIRAAHDQADHLARIVDDLVYMARETNELELAVSAVSLDRVVEEVRRVMNDSSTGFESEVEPNLVAGIDPIRVTQAITNLMTNAARYGGEQRRLVVRSDGTTLLVEVHDNGSGVPRAHLPSIWRSFERGAHALDSVQPGSGLGLAIVEAIVRGHGGEVGYRTSESLGGACFWLRFPGRVLRHRNGVDAAQFEPAAPFAT